MSLRFSVSAFLKQYHVFEYLCVSVSFTVKYLGRNFSDDGDETDPFAQNMRTLWKLFWAGADIYLNKDLGETMKRSYLQCCVSGARARTECLNSS